MIMLFNQLLDMPQLSCGWITLTNETILCTIFEKNKLFVRMDIFWDLLFQMMGLTFYMLRLYFCSV
jgi:hypothetical protein